MATTLDLNAIRARMEVAKQGFKRAGSTYKLKPGQNKFVILPPWNGVDWYRPFGQHWVKSLNPTAKAVAYVCDDRTHGKPCEVCEALANVAATTGAVNPQVADVVKESYAGQYYVLGVLALDDSNPNAEQVIQLGGRAMQALHETVNQWLETVFDPSAPQVIVIDRQGSGMDTNYTVTITPAKHKLTKSVKPIDLDQWVDQGSEQGLNRALNAVKALAGPVAPTAAGLGHVPRHAGMLTQDPDFEDIPSGPSAAPVAARPATVQRPAAAAPVAPNAPPGLEDDIDALLNS